MVLSVIVIFWHIQMNETDLMVFGILPYQKITTTHLGTYLERPVILVYRQQPLHNS